MVCYHNKNVYLWLFFLTEAKDFLIDPRIFLLINLRIGFVCR